MHSISLRPRLASAALAALALVACTAGAPSPQAELDMARRAPASEAMAAGGLLSFEEEAEARDAGDDTSDGPKKVETWKRAEILPNASRLKIGDDEELPLKGLQASVRIDGFRARVLLDLFFYNDRDGQYEGTFELRLPNEASPSFLAFGASVQEAALPEDAAFLSAAQVEAQTLPADILQARAESWTQPQVARVVPKEKAAFAYGSTVRRRVDPALMEWAGAGVFRSRVFPLQPERLHRIVIGYDLNLLAAGSDLEYRLDLPAAPRTVVDLSVGGLDPARVQVEPAAEPSPVDDALRHHYRYEDPRQRVITVRLTDAADSLLAGEDPAIGACFAAACTPELPADPAAPVAAGASEAVFLVDVSLSSNPVQFNVWLALLRALLEENRDVLQRFAVLFFNVERFWWREAWTENTPEQVEALLGDAADLALEGATDLAGALGEGARPGWQDGDAAPRELFLLSDGAATWGEGDAHAQARLLGDATLFAYRTGFAGADLEGLAQLTRASRGAVFSVVGEAEVPRAARAHRRRAWTLEGVELEGGTDLLLAGRPSVLFPGQRLLLSGRGSPAPDAPLRLRLRRGDEERQLDVALPAAFPSPLAPRIYGQIATGQLEELREASEATAAAYAKHFRVPGRTCSLLMLETEEDYQRFGIKPEEDAFVVKTSPVGELLDQLLAAIGDALGDPKARFLAFLERLERMPGMTFETPLALRKTLASLPAEAFALEPPPLRCAQRTWKNVPGPFQEQLVSKKLIYDDVVAEARRRRARHGPADALRALSSLVEANPGDTVLARDVGFAAMEWGLGAQAVHLFRRVAASRPYEPQTYRALAECLGSLGRVDLALAYYEVGLAGTWDGRFGEFRRIHGLSYLRFLRRIAAGELVPRAADYAAARLRTVAQEFDLGKADLVVTITWNTDGTDVDLHVIEPGGEECFYSHPRTEMGGRLTQDVTTGYGPEMYVLPEAESGTFHIRVRYFASDANRASTRTKVYATVFRGWGTPQETVTRKVVTLALGKEMHDIATVKLD